jgi:hypothetical protein
MCAVLDCEDRDAARQADLTADQPIRPGVAYCMTGPVQDCRHSRSRSMRSRRASTTPGSLLYTLLLRAREGRLCVDGRRCLEIGYGRATVPPRGGAVVCADAKTGATADDKTGKTAVVLCRY